MLRLSSQSKSTPWDDVAETSATGMWTSPKLIAPFQIARAMVRFPCREWFSLVTFRPLKKFPLGAGWRWGRTDTMHRPGWGLWASLLAKAMCQMSTAP
ncbi:hypothetical protein ALO79_200199 [Pseudomonas syringae pv. castaneae]|uniref:Uncharacterized protein n=1 Tax=Pseudomonas syringae pv. castaneae TaxID=264450 RepID=A0A0P9NN06_PSESX|nr:hypothetical protein ALO79_200199 [Pseudomonas syringae pv. castaneae]